MTLKSIYLFLPLVVAMGWGINSAITGQNFATRAVNIPTDVMAIGLSIIVVAFLASHILNQPIDLSLYLTSPSRGWLWAACLSFAVCMLLIRISFAGTSATYTVLLESTYALFTPLFVWLFFQQKQLNLQMLIGGGLIMLGTFLVVSGQIQKSSSAGV